jgi:hypothetical protein
VKAIGTSDGLAAAAARLDTWIEAQGFRGWDPYDALNSPLLKRLTFKNRRIGQLWVQLLKNSPVNLRSLLGVPQGYNPKGMGLFLASYWCKYRLAGKPVYLERVRFFADWLAAHTSSGYSGACWGYNFDWPNRGFYAPEGTPTIVNTAFIGLAFLDLMEPPEVAAQIGWGKERVLTLARSACDFILHDLWSDRPAPDELRFSYTPLDRRIVHNANVLGAALLAKVAASTGDCGLAELALAAARYTAGRIRADGSWLYGETRGDWWIDNFHTGFVLVALQRVSVALNSAELEAALQQGYAYWKAHFFTPDGAPKYYADRTYPIDVHSAAQALLTLLAFSKTDPEAGALAVRTAHWAVENMQDHAGFFHYQIHHTYRIRIPYMRWAQAWMQRALVELECGLAA